MFSPEAIAAIERAGVRHAYLFGSRACGQERVDSDTDLGVWFGSFDPLERFERAARLESELRNCIPGPLDLVVLDDANPVLQYEAVIRGVPLIPESPARIFAFESMIRQRYEDYSYSQRFFNAARRARLGLA